MTTTMTTLKRLFLGLGVIAAGASFAPAGEIALSWAPSHDDVTAGYKVEVLDAEGQLTDTIDAKKSTRVTIDHLADGVRYRFRVRPYDQWGHDAAVPSADIVTMAAPRVDAVENWVAKGDTASCTLVGVNFDQGANVALASAGAKVTAVTIASPTHLTLQLRGIASTPLAKDFTVVNPVRHSDKFVGQHPELVDVNRDGTVDRNDIALVQAAFGSTRGSRAYHADLDVNGDGVIDGEDIAAIKAALKN